MTSSTPTTMTAMPQGFFHQGRFGLGCRTGGWAPGEGGAGGADEGAGGWGGFGTVM